MALCVLGTVCLPALAQQGDPAFPGDPTERMAKVRSIANVGGPDAAERLKRVFESDPEDDIVIAAGKYWIPRSAPEDLKGIVARLATFHGPLPAMNLGPVLASRANKADLRKELGNAFRSQDWSALRNACLLLAPIVSAEDVPTLRGILGYHRIVRLEVVNTLSLIKDRSAVRVVESIYDALHPEDIYGKAACLMALGDCGTAEDVPWLLQRSNSEDHDSVFCARAIAKLAKALPKKETFALIHSTKNYGRRAGCILLKELGRQLDWLELLQDAGNLEPDVLECLGEKFEEEALPELTDRLYSFQMWEHKSWRVSDSWCRAIGRSAAGADRATQAKVLALFHEKAWWKIADPFRDYRNYSALYGLEAVGTPEALDMLVEVAVQHWDEAVSVTAAAGVMQSGDETACARLRRKLVQAAVAFDSLPDRALHAFAVMGAVPHGEIVDTLITGLGRVQKKDHIEVVLTSLDYLTGHRFGNEPALWRTWWDRAGKDFEFIEAKYERTRKAREARQRALAQKALQGQQAQRAARGPGNAGGPAAGAGGEPGALGMKPDETVEALIGVRAPAANPVPNPVVPFAVAEDTVPEVLALRRIPDYALEEYKGDEKTQRAVGLALRWLADHQDPDGKWSGRHYRDLDIGRETGEEPDKRLGAQTLDLGVTGLALMAFLSANHTHVAEDSIYRETVRRAFRWLSCHQLTDGAFQDQGLRTLGWSYYSYEMGINATALSELYAMTGDERAGKMAQRCLDKVLAVQVRADGWRYYPRQQADISVVSWMVMALRSACMAGLKVDPRGRIGALRFLSRVSTVPEGRENPEDDTDSYWYPVGKADPKARDYANYMQGYIGIRRNAAAMSGLCRIFLGYRRSHPYSVGVASFLRMMLPRYGANDYMKGLNVGMGGMNLVDKYKPDPRPYYFPLYYIYFGTLMMHEMGGDFWKAWNDELKALVVPAQRMSPSFDYGAFYPTGGDGDIAGQVYSTAMCAMSLMIYYRYLPMVSLR